MSESAELFPLSADLSLLVDFDFSMDGELFQDEELRNITYLDENVIPDCNLASIEIEEPVDQALIVHDNNKKTKKLKTEKQTKQSAPLMRMKKLPKNDIRKYFANMFLNTINSGEFHHAQNFFQTFMTKSCKFMTGQNFPIEANVPSIINGNGPNLFAHYFLGMHVMFPDIVLKMNNSRMETCPRNKTTRIVVDLECNFTKTVHIPYELWIPPEHLLEDIYAAQTLEEITSVLRGTYIADKAADTVVATPTGAKVERVEPAAVPVDTLPASVATTIQEQDVQMKADSSFTSDSAASSVLSKRKHSTSTTARPATASKHSSGSSCSTGTTTSAGLPYYLPAQYITQLLRAAQPLAQPVPVHSVGQLEIVLDEHKHILYMGLNHVLL